MKIQIGFLWLFLASCSLTPVNTPLPFELQLPIFKNFELGTLEGFYPELPTLSNAQMVTPPPGGPLNLGTQSLQLTVAPGQEVNHGNRAEVALYQVGQYGSTVFFGWRFYIPTGDPDSFTWQIMAQWYQLPDFWKGENFDAFFAHPPVVFTYTPGFVEVQTSVGGEVTLGKTPITKGNWHSVVYEICFRDDAQGFVQVWVDGIPLTPSNGTDNRVYRPTLHNRAGTYWKLGLYRGIPSQTQAPTTNSVILDNIAVGSTYNEVLP